MGELSVGLLAKISDREYERVAELTGETVQVVVLKDRIAYLERQLAEIKGTPWIDCRPCIPNFNYNSVTELNMEKLS